MWSSVLLSFFITLYYIVSLFSATRAASSPLYVVTSVRWVHTDFNISLFDPFTGTFNQTTSLSVADGYQDSLQHAVFQPSTQSLMINHGSGYNHQWIWYSVERRAVVKIGTIIREAFYSPGCFVRDDADGITWSLTFNYTYPGSKVAIATLYKYPDKGGSPFRPEIVISLPFSYYHPPIPVGCGFNTANKSLYFVLNDKVPYLYALDLANGILANSIQWPHAKGGQPQAVYALAYSNKQQKLYAFVTADGGIGGQSIVVVDPVTGQNQTVISSALTPNWILNTAYVSTPQQEPALLVLLAV